MSKRIQTQYVSSKDIVQSLEKQDALQPMAVWRQN